jgi:hypothetical protein
MSKLKKNKEKQEAAKLMMQYKITKDEAFEWLNNLDTPNKSHVNVLFYPAQHTEDTKVYVQNPLTSDVIELQGVIRAKLDYDPELGFPVLGLEIINPHIKHTD